MCDVSHVTCKVSPVTCHMSNISHHHILSVFVFVFFFSSSNIEPVPDPRQDGVDDKLHGLDHPHPQPHAHGAPHLREEAGQAERKEISLRHQHLAREGESKSGEISVIRSVKKMLRFRASCCARQGTVRELATDKQVNEGHTRGGS